MTRSLTALLIALLFMLPGITSSQESDFAIKKDFESRYDRLTRFLDGATNTGELDTLKRVIDGLELDFTPRAAFLDKALYPVTFAQKMKALRLQYARTYDMLHVMETQGAQIAQMEGTIAELTFSLDTLQRERDVLFLELKQNRSSMTAMRETIRKLQAHLKVNDQLLFALLATSCSCRTARTLHRSAMHNAHRSPPHASRKRTSSRVCTIWHRTTSGS